MPMRPPSIFHIRLHTCSRRKPRFYVNPSLIEGRQKMSNMYHAMPYDISATRLYFKNYEDYAEQVTKRSNTFGNVGEEF